MANLFLISNTCVCRYTVSKEKEANRYTFVAFRLFFDVLQLLLLTLKPSHGWNIDAESK